MMGIVRSLYRAEVAAGAPALRLAEVAAVGLTLQEAYELAMESEPKTLQHYAAWKKAEQGANALGDLIEPWTPAWPILEAAMRAVGARKKRI